MHTPQHVPFPSVLQHSPRRPAQHPAETSSTTCRLSTSRTTRACMTMSSSWGPTRQTPNWKTCGTRLVRGSVGAHASADWWPPIGTAALPLDPDAHLSPLRGTLHHRWAPLRHVQQHQLHGKMVAPTPGLLCGASSPCQSAVGFLCDDAPLAGVSLGSMPVGQDRNPSMQHLALQAPGSGAIRCSGLDSPRQALLEAADVPMRARSEPLSDVAYWGFCSLGRQGAADWPAVRSAPFGSDLLNAAVHHASPWDHLRLWLVCTCLHCLFPPAAWSRCWARMSCGQPLGQPGGAQHASSWHIFVCTCTWHHAESDHHCCCSLDQQGAGRD